MLYKVLFFDPSINKKKNNEKNIRYSNINYWMELKKNCSTKPTPLAQIHILSYSISQRKISQFSPQPF